MRDHVRDGEVSEIQHTLAFPTPSGMIHAPSRASLSMPYVLPYRDVHEMQIRRNTDTYNRVRERKH